MKTYALFDYSFFQNKPWWIPQKLYQVVCHRANPRSQEEMVKILQEFFPHAQLIDTNQAHETGKIILLYPDAIGIGWSRLEEKICLRFQEIKVLNGRKRCFSLTKSRRRQLIIKRFLEITFLSELLFAPLLVIYGILITIKDKLMSRF